MKLPKLELPTYNGDRVNFKEFWDALEATVHKNMKFSNIEKFNYLKGRPPEPPKSAISGLSFSNGNDDVAITILW